MTPDSHHFLLTSLAMSVVLFLSIFPLSDHNVGGPQGCPPLTLSPSLLFSREISFSATALNITYMLMTQCSISSPDLSFTFRTCLHLLLLSPWMSNRHLNPSWPKTVLLIFLPYEPLPSPFQTPKHFLEAYGKDVFETDCLAHYNQEKYLTHFKHPVAICFLGSRFYRLGYFSLISFSSFLKWSQWMR